MNSAAQTSEIGVSLLTRYLNDIGKHPLLSEEEEATATPERLILANLRLVVKISKDYGANLQDRLDTIQDGNVGLVKASRTFSSEKGKFSVWAAYHIRREIRNRSTDAFGSLAHSRDCSEISKSLVQDYPVETIKEDRNIKDLDKELTLERAKNFLSRRELKVLDMYLSGCTHKQVSQQLNITIQGAQYIRKTGLEKLKDVIL